MVRWDTSTRWANTMSLMPSTASSLTPNCPRSATIRTRQFSVLPNDTYGLYSTNMETLDPETSSVAGINYYPGAAAGAKFSVQPGYENKPVVWVSGSTALRFANWLQNGQGNGSTESGTYTISSGGKNTGTLADDPRRRLDIECWALGAAHRERVVQGGVLQGRRD